VPSSKFPRLRPWGLERYGWFLYRGMPMWCGVVRIVDSRQFRPDWFQGCLSCQRSWVLKGSMLPLATGARSKFGTRSRILRGIGTASSLLSSSVTGAQQLVWVHLVCILISSLIFFSELSKVPTTYILRSTAAKWGNLKLSCPSTFLMVCITAWRRRWTYHCLHSLFSAMENSASI